jgi:UDP-glucose 4-epimerase
LGSNQNHSTWVVTGAAGFLGSHVVEQLLKRDIPVLGIDNLSGGKWQFLAPFASNPLFKFASVDIRDEAALTDLFRRERPDVCVHLAALHFIPAAMRNPGLAVSLNVHGTQTLLSACRESKVSRFWFSSTADVYKASDQAHHESSPIGPFNIYGVTKWMGEQLVQLEAGIRPDCHFVIGRLFNLYGPHETNPHILPEVIDQIRSANGSVVLRLGNVTPKRDLVPIVDAARAVIAVLEKSAPGVTTVNVGTGVTVSVQEVVERIGTILGRPIRIEIDPAKVRAVERGCLQADVKALRSLIGWAPDGDLTRGLRELLIYEGVAK